MNVCYKKFEYKQNFWIFGSSSCASNLDIAWDFLLLRIIILVHIFNLCDQTYILIYFHINGRYQGLCLIDNKNRKHWKLATFFRSWQRKEILKKERKNYSNFTHNFNMSTLWYTVLNNISPVIFPVISLDITGYQISKFILLIWESNVAIIICSFIAYINRLL